MGETSGGSRGLTLIEAIIVLGVLWLGAEIVVGPLAANRERARRHKCRSNLKNAFGYAMALYSGDYGNSMPPTVGHLFGDYVSDGEGFLCPTAGKATEMMLTRGPSRDKYTPDMFGDTHTDYVYVSGLRATDPPGYVSAFDDEWNHGGEGVYALHVGGQVVWLTDFKALHEKLDKQEAELAAQGREMKLLRPAWSLGSDRLPDARQRSWYSSFGGRAVAVVAFVAAAVALAILARKFRRDGSDPPRSGDGGDEVRASDGPA